MRVRISYAKEGSLVYTSTLDVQKLWERSSRRAGLRLQYSQGFHPQPKIQIANPLPLGFTGLNELVDIWFVDEKEPQEIFSDMQKSLPDGIRLNSITEIPPNRPSLPKQADYSEYIVYIRGYQDLFDEISKKCDALLGRDSIERIRNRKNYDLRPLIMALSAKQLANGNIAISMRLPTNSNKTGRPEEVMYELGFTLDEFKVVRDKLVLREPKS